MCGICGIRSFKRQVEPSSINAMIDTLYHRGPDGNDRWIDEDQKIGLGHTRLSIIDLSSSGKQPMHYLNGRYTITFNGEIYNYVELKEQLAKKGYKFTSDTDTEVLLALYDLKKAACLNDLDGMFAFAIWDNIEQKLFCARDRFGEKPFFYYLNNDKFVFASEIKALWKAGIEKKVNNKFVYTYLLFGSLQDNNDLKSSFYHDIYNLEPSHYLEIDKNGTINLQKYWNIDYRSINYKISIEEAKEEFYRLFKDSVQKRLRSDVPVGSSLSGGLDSSSIVAMIGEVKNKNQSQKTFSARFKNYSKDEGVYIEKVVNSLNGVDPYSVYPTEQSALSNLEKIIYHQDEPFGSFSISAQYEVMQLAKQNGVKVLLDGQGADEYLAGYTMYFNSYYNQLYREDRKLFEIEQKKYEEIHSNHFPNPSFSARVKTKSETFYQKIAHFKRQQTSNKSEYFQGIHPDIVDEFKTVKNPIHKPSNLKEHLYSSSTQKGLSELLRYADRNSMAHSIEVRLPFLSHHLVEFSFSLPNHYLIHDSWTKYILRKSMENYLPQEVSWRKDKIGYEPPQNDWLANPKLKEKVDDSISKLTTNKIIIKPYKQLNWQYLMLASYLN